ncbi:hypothetical protein ACHWQZ_G006354 [Mnemiopsis leidyi]
MGSSASIMQATLNAGGDVQNSTITFHCQELREAGETEHVTAPAPPNNLSLNSPDSGVTSPGDNVTSSPSLPNKTLSPQEEQAAVTRYFPIIQPQISNFIPRIEIIDHNMLPNFLDTKPGTDTKDRHTKENYYYSCDICSKGFMFKGSLNRHLARHVQSGREGDEIRATPRQFPIANRSGIGTSEVRYQLKDPRLYEQQGKLQIHQQEKRASKATSTTHGTKSYSSRKSRDKCSLCGTVGHNPSSCKTFPRNLVLGQKVLAICSCLKCNRSFDDVDKLKDHISKCQGFDRPKQIVQSECNVR